MTELNSTNRQSIELAAAAAGWPQERIDLALSRLSPGARTTVSDYDAIVAERQRIRDENGQQVLAHLALQQEAAARDWDQERIETAEAQLKNK